MPKPKNSPKRYDPLDPDIRHMGAWSWNTRYLWAKVQPACADQCWTWTGSYGPHANLFGARKNHRPQMTQANRLIYAEVHNIDVTDLEIRHSCGNRYCCNPQHMFTQHNHMTAPAVKYVPKRVKARALPAAKTQQPWWQL